MRLSREQGRENLRRMCAAANYLPAGQDKINRSARTEFGDYHADWAICS